MTIACTSTVAGVSASTHPLDEAAEPIVAQPGAPGTMWVWADPWMAGDDAGSLHCTGSSGALQATATIDVAVTLDNGFTPTTMDLPVVTITTEGGALIDSREDYVNAKISIDANGGNASCALGEKPTQIRGRGNSSWTLAPKKPYKLKLDKKAALCGLSNDKEWALLANYADKTLMRNRVAMELSRRFNMAYTPRSQPVEVFINGRYAGSYLLSETIKISSERVNIVAMKDGDIAPETITGGYLLEVDERRDGNIVFDTLQGVTLVLHDPDPDTPVQEQRDYIRDYVQNTEDALFAPGFADPDTGYPSYLDSGSFLNWYLVNELFSNVDSTFYSSCWMYKDRGDKLFMGPVWDFDLGAGNMDYGSGSEYPDAGWWTRNGTWMGRLFADPVFAEAARTRWNELKAEQIDTIFDYIDQQALALNQGQQNNFQRWPVLDRYVWPKPPDPSGTYTGEVERLKTWLRQRIDWMDAQFNP